jgi:hypothetical protein
MATKEANLSRLQDPRDVIAALQKQPALRVEQNCAGDSTMVVGRHELEPRSSGLS